MATIEFFYDFTSPFSYLASTQVDGIVQRTGATLVAKPFLLGAVFKAAGGHSILESPARLAHNMKDIHVWAKEYGVPFNFPTAWPANTIKAARLVAASGDAGWGLSKRLFNAFWAGERDITQLDVLAAIAAEAGLDADALMARIEQQDVKDQVRAWTDEAVARGAFGAPTFFVGDQMFFGNDRLAFLERAARGERLYP